MYRHYYASIGRSRSSSYRSFRLLIFLSAQSLIGLSRTRPREKHLLPNINTTAQEPVVVISYYSIKMSTASKITLAGTLLGTAGIITFVHWAQTSEKAAMHAGVIRDMQNQKEKRERQADFDMQRQLEQEYRKVQTVSASQD